ncbi:MAG: hypothetical protein ACRDF4_06255 [Rhabdochlamydiaceae bacterium]
MATTPFGEEPSIYKVLVYNQLAPDEVAKANIDVKKVSFWDISASVPGKTGVDDPHISVFWYGPHVSSERGLIIHLKSHKLDAKYSDPIKALVASKVGGSATTKDNETEFKNFAMKISYGALAELAKAMQDAGKLSCECSVEYEMVTKEEKAGSTLPKTKILGEKPLEK